MFNSHKVTVATKEVRCSRDWRDPAKIFLNAANWPPRGEDRKGMLGSSEDLPQSCQVTVATNVVRSSSDC